METHPKAKANVGRDEPAYVVPATPSPFLHSAFPPSVVPPFSYSSGLYDLGLPPAYGTDCEVPVGQYTDDGQYMQGLGLPCDAGCPREAEHGREDQVSRKLPSSCSPPRVPETYPAIPASSQVA